MKTIKLCPSVRLSADKFSQDNCSPIFKAIFLKLGRDFSDKFNQKVKKAGHNLVDYLVLPGDKSTTYAFLSPLLPSAPYYPRITFIYA